MTGILVRYDALVGAGELRADPDQRGAAERLDELQGELEATSRKRGFIGKLFGGDAPARPRGVYMWGGVGRGKSMLMDLFVETLDIERKRRVHFHAFMLEVDQLIREERKRESGDPIAPVAAKLAQDVRLLAFDEMVVNNTADAAIMSRLFTALIRDENVVVVTTSNRPPRDLYKDGLNRSLFLPFIDLVQAELDVVPLNGPVDYRLERLGGLDSWHTPLGEEATAQVREAFFRLTDYAPEDAENVPSGEIDLGGGRTLFVPKAFKGVGVFSFKRLCGENRGAADYLALAHAFHTVIVVGIPEMGPGNRNEAIRFTKLVDALYENRVKLFATAQTEPEDLYTAGDGAFEFDRTVSRLKEMQSEDYMAAGHGAQ
ncbi:cell division protein ZapE [Alteriqipengyuania flavescens]|uniref:cell division protein ZapE n=1 Tax=Alteriqipengyuania flavescens TaxID=3053610 RepID=UPI0025B54ADF|nr:cell division protein ZapE [Alteriqipengyuania flavescens]WJY18454.1 cell division protein ZapE [Alteriqipengyuania flavescens]WJY24395.1 cell division protein ZapE [Alteriqipengyuania flavescens]